METGLASLVALVLGSGGVGALLLELVKSLTRGGDRRQEAIDAREKRLDEAADRISGWVEADNARLRQEIGEIRQEVASLRADLRLALDDLALAIAHGRAMRRHLPADSHEGQAFDLFAARAGHLRANPGHGAAMRRLEGE